MPKRYASDDDTSDPDSEYDPTSMRSQSEQLRRSIRYSSKPKRFGANANNNFSFDETSPEPFGEDSCAEDSYAPPPPKKRKEVSFLTSSSSKNEHAQALTKSYQKMKNQQKSMAILYDTSRNHTQQDVIPDFNSHFAKVSAPKNHGSLKQPVQIIPTMKAGLLQQAKSVVATAPVDATNHHNSCECCKKMDELLARITVFERKFIDALSHRQTSNIKIEENSSDPKMFEQREAFIKSNRMPIENSIELNRFDENLKCSDFLNTAVSLLPHTMYVLFLFHTFSYLGCSFIW